MPPTDRTLTEEASERIDYAIRELLPHLSYLDARGPNEVYERSDDLGSTWRAKSHWFPPNEEHPDPTMRPPMLEISVTLTTYARGKRFHAWFYRPGTGNDVHPAYGDWRVHVWVCQ